MVTVPIQQVSSSVPLLILQSSISHLLNQYLLPVKNHSYIFHPPNIALEQSSSVLEMVKVTALTRCKYQYYNLPPRTVSPVLVAIVASRAVDPVGSPSSTTNDQDDPCSIHGSDHRSLVPQGQKASDYDNSDPVPPRQNVVPTAEKTDSSQQGLEFLFSPLLGEDYKSNTTVKLRKTTIIKHECIVSEDDLSILYVHRYKKIDDRLPQILKCVCSRSRWSIVERRNIKEAMVIVLAIDAMRMNFHQFEQSDGIDFEESFAPVAAWKEFGIFVALAAQQVFHNTISDVMKTDFLIGSLKDEVYVALPEGFRDPESLQKKSYF
ncbi:retrovirus-related pol polyprotein from transposon TNT 1-94 [Tanacetum coccineum]